MQAKKRYGLGFFLQRTYIGLDGAAYISTCFHVYGKSRTQNTLKFLSFSDEGQQKD